MAVAPGVVASTPASGQKLGESDVVGIEKQYFKYSIGCLGPPVQSKLTLGLHGAV